MSPIGIDAISIYTPPYSLPLTELARARGIDPLKYTVGLGQETMSVMPPREDIVTMAASAALPLLNKNPELKNTISLVIFATESGVDQSKAAGTWVHNLLQLNSKARVIELKQACYSATFALQMACAFMKQTPHQCALVIASDTARYGINTPGEPTQGCGAVAFIVKQHPRLIEIEEGAGIHTEHVMDFWRPPYLDTALVDGKYSTRVYLTALQTCWDHYQEATNRQYESHARFCYHVPFCKMAEKAHERLAKESCSDNSKHALIYPKLIGNSYSASLYISLASLLENDPEDLSGQRIGFFSYGSGCVAEFFSGVVAKGYQQYMAQEWHHHLIQSRTPLSCPEYEQFFLLNSLKSTESYSTIDSAAGSFEFLGVEGHVRRYKKKQSGL